MTDQLINLRQARVADPVWHLLETGELVRLAPTQAVNRQLFNSLSRHDQARLRAIAVGRGKTRAVLIGRSAARVHGTWVVATTRELMETSYGRFGFKTSAQLPEGQMVRKHAINPEDVSVIHGARALTPFRAAADVAATYGLTEGLVAMSWLKHRGLGLWQLEQLTRELGPMKGIGTVRRAVELSSAKSLSPFEPFAQGVLLGAGIPVRMHVPMAVSTGKIVELDLVAGPRGEVAVEIDGDVKYDGATYGSTDAILRAERQREKLIRNEGMPVVRFSPRQLLRERDYCVETVARAVAREQELRHPELRKGKR